VADLTTLTAVKAYTGIPTSGADPLLSRLISAASAAVESWCGRSLLSAARTETRDGPGSAQLVLRDWPVTAVAGVTVNGASMPARPAIGQRGYVLVDAERAPTLTLDGGALFPRGAGNVVVSYTAGYLTVPADLEQAVIDLVVLKFEQRTKVGKASEVIGSAQVNYTFGKIPADVQAVLAPYRRVVLP
jgi:uncharacterized phiE125 gp8 family phage protein